MGKLDVFLGEIFSFTKNAIGEAAAYAVWWSIVSFAAGIVLISLGGMTGAAWLTSLALFFIASGLLVWAFVGGIVLDWARRAGIGAAGFRVVGTLLSIIGLIALLALGLPAGWHGIATLLSNLILSAIIIVVLTAVLGLSLRRAAMTAFVLVGSWIVLNNYAPRLTSQLPWVRGNAETRLMKALPRAQELFMSLDTLTGATASAPRLFVNSEPLWWCRSDHTRVEGWRCFDQPGTDPVTNGPLIPISTTIVNDAIARLEQVSAQQKAEAEANRLAAERTAEQKRRQEEEVAAEVYRKRYVTKLASPVRFGLFVETEGQADRHLADQIRKELGQAVAEVVLTEAVTEDGVFDRLFAGDGEEFQYLKLSESAEKILLIRNTVRSRVHSEYSGAVVLNLSASVRLFDARNGHLLNSFQVSHEAMGRLQFAQEAVEDRLVSETASQLKRK